MFANFKKIGLLGFLLLGSSSVSFAENHHLAISSLDSPTPVTTNNKQLIVYELHIVNNGNQTQHIGLLEIKDNQNQLLKSYAGETLAQNSFVYKAEQRIKENAIDLEAHMGAFIYVFIELNKDSPLPTQLTNTIWTTQVNEDKSEAKAKSLSYTLSVKTETPIALGPPLKGDNWVAVGSIASDSYHRRAILPLEGNFYLAQRFAIDWEQIYPNGHESKGNMHKNSNWRAYGHDVLAVADGTVVNMRDAIEKDNTPPGFPNTSPNILDVPGNFLIINIKKQGRDYFVFYGHLQPHSIKVQIGDTVSKGQVIGTLGNTGNSAAPHLHMHVSETNDPLKTNGLPFVFENIKFTGVAEEINNDYGIFLPKYGTKPQTYENILPRANTIVNFD
jgi:murein DD-endopeptidase MepM/ murein hydrolase activator NlpD